MSDLLRIRPAASPEMIDVFSDEAVIRHALAFEEALARAQAEEGLIAGHIAEAITRACRAFVVDPAWLADAAALAGTLAIPLVAALRATLRADAREALHRGSTSQDLADTVLMMQIAAGEALLARDLDRAISALCASARRYAAVPAVGRTLLQDALPIGFGLRLAQSAVAIDDARRRLAVEVATHGCVQLGGAAGTRSDLGGRGASVTERVASSLNLNAGPPWHARRGGVAAIGSATAIIIGSLGKFARDISLLSQNSIGEAREPRVDGRGGSSAMAHKRNPTGCQVALSAALRAPGLASALLGALPQEHERGLGGWQAEAPLIADLFLLASGSAAAMADIAEGLEVEEHAIARNLEASGLTGGIGESADIVAHLLDTLA